MTKKGILLLVAVAGVVLYTAFYWGCSNKERKGLVSLLEEDERDCEAAYREIADRDYFYSAEKAVEMCDTFLSHFQYQRCAYSEEVREMKRAFGEIGDALERSYYSYEHFKTETGHVSQEMEASPYRVVRKTWETLLREADSLRKREALVSLTEKDFEVYMHDYVQEVCREKYGVNFWDMKVSSIKLKSITRPAPVEGKAAMGCTAIYEIKLKGPVLGLLEKTDRLTLMGELGFTNEGKQIFHHKGYSTQ